jgi:TPP-dependent pyruvate/acetoin dehydrogenase alpha subunit
MQEVRALSAPRALILHTCRFGPHSKGDDTRSPDEVARLRQQRDPLTIHATRLSLDERQTTQTEVNRLVEGAFQQALQDPFPVIGDAS